MIYSLSPILDAVSSGAGDPTSHVDLTLDLSTNRVSDGWHFRRRKFRIVNARDPKAYVQVDELPVEVGDYDSDEPSVKLKIGYQARCAPGDEVRLVEALGPAEDPLSVVNRQIVFWVDDCVHRLRLPLDDNFMSHAGTLKHELGERARRELGLTLALRVRLTGRERLETLHIGPKELQVRVSGQRQRMGIQIELELPIDEALVVRAVRQLSLETVLERNIDRLVSRFFEEEVSLHDFHYSIETQVARALRSRIEEYVTGWGRYVDRLYLVGTTEVENLVEDLETSHEFYRELPEYPDPVMVQCKFLLSLIDVGRYVAAGSPPLESWAREAIERVTRSVLFSTRYSELIRCYDEKKSQIEEDMRAEAKTIGYTVEQLVTITDLQMEILQRPFTVPVIGEFATRAPRVLAGLETQITCRITDTSRIEALLDRRQDVKAAIAALVHQRIATQLHNVEPEEFYLYFSTPRVAVVTDDEPHLAQQTLDQRLRQETVDCLNEYFLAEVSSIVFKQTDTVITELLHELRRRPHTFPVEVQPKGGAHLPATFDAVLVVKAVDSRGWHNFLECRPGPEDVVQTVRQALEFKLSEVRPDQLYSLPAEQLRGHINVWAIDRIGEQYGLEVEITDLRRQHTREEELRVQTRQKLVEAEAKERSASIEQFGRQRHMKRKLVDRRQSGYLEQYDAVLEKLKGEVDEFEIEQLEQKLDKAAEKVLHPTEQDDLTKIAGDLGERPLLGGYGGNGGATPETHLISLSEDPPTPRRQRNDRTSDRDTQDHHGDER